MGLYEGDSVVITCNRSDIKWTFNKQPLPSRFIITGNSVYIESANQSDNGILECGGAPENNSRPAKCTLRVGSKKNIFQDHYIDKSM